MCVSNHVSLLVGVNATATALVVMGVGSRVERSLARLIFLVAYFIRHKFSIEATHNRSVISFLYIL